MINLLGNKDEDNSVEGARGGVLEIERSCDAEL
jgi:hypothetical protein